jgi:hypothetical protein
MVTSMCSCSLHFTGRTIITFTTNDKLSNVCVRNTQGRLAAEITTKLKDNYSINFSIHTTKQCLKDAGLDGKHPVIKPFILGEKSEVAISVCNEV